MTPPEIIGSLRDAVASQGSGSSDFDLNPNADLSSDRSLREAAVLVPITMQTGRAEVVLTKRSSALKHHPGQIAFPGGKQDDTDADLIATALREAREEIGNGVSKDGHGLSQ